MAEFRFRLATLLRVRETARDECRVSLADAQRADEELRDQLARLGEIRLGLQEECRKAAEPGSLDVERLAESHRYDAALRVEEDGLRRRRETLAAEIEQRRQAVLAADRDVRVLEKLRERRLQRHRIEEGRQESKLLDEAALRAVAS